MPNFVPFTAAKGDLCMLLATLAWGSSYLFMQQGLRSIEPFNLIALRFTLGFLVALPLLVYKKLPDLRMLRQSAILGFYLCSAFYGVMSGLATTTTGKAGFLCGATVVFVQLQNAKRGGIAPTLLAATLLALAGIASLSLQKGFRIGTGDLFCLAGAFLYSRHILLSGDFLRQTPALELGIWQLGWTALFGWTATLLLETPHLPQTEPEWQSVLFLGLICSALGFLLQAEAQKRVDTGKIGILYAMEPVFAMTLGIFVLHEPATIRGFVGALLILSAVLLVNLKLKKCPLPDDSSRCEPHKSSR